MNYLCIRNCCNLMLFHTTEFCELQLFDRYAILKAFENQWIDHSKTNTLIALFENHFRQNEFVLISDRSNVHQIDLNVYKQSKLPTLKGIAVVSAEPKERDRAMQEQSLFDKSFAFFERLDDAVHWANGFFR